MKTKLVKLLICSLLAAASFASATDLPVRTREFKVEIKSKSGVDGTTFKIRNGSNWMMARTETSDYIKDCNWGPNSQSAIREPLNLGKTLNVSADNNIQSDWLVLMYSDTTLVRLDATGTNECPTEFPVINDARSNWSIQVHPGETVIVENDTLKISVTSLDR